jgi:hypothetical protein
MAARVTDTRTRAVNVLSASLRVAIVRHPDDIDLQLHIHQLLTQLQPQTN